MQRLVALVLLSCAGCHFRVDALPGGATAVDDLAVGDVDLGTVDPADLAAGSSGDLAGVVADMTFDPCANPPALGAGNVAAQCVIGNPPTIDGNLTDWPPGLFAPLTRSTPGVITTTPSAWPGPAATDDADSSARWAVRWDLTYVYIAVSVVDDIRKTPDATSLTQNDCVELFLDGLHDRTQAYGGDDWQLVYSADGKTATYQDGQAAAVPNGVTVQTAYGGSSPDFTVEVAVPWAMLGGTAATLGRVVGFDLKLDDNDSGLTTRDRDLTLFYTAPGGGSCTAAYCRTDAFGAVQLQGR